MYEYSKQKLKKSYKISYCSKLAITEDESLGSENVVVRLL